MYSRVKLFLFVIKIVLLISLFIFNSCGNGDQSKGKAHPPAKVANQIKENALSTITLSPEAEGRLGIKTTVVEKKSIPKTLKLGGEIVARSGQEVKVAAPIAGTILGSKDGNLLQAGSFVRKGQEVMRLLLMPPEKDLMSAHEEVSVKQVEYDVALAKAKRAEQLLPDKAISEKSYQETQALLAAAKAALNAAKGRLNLLSSTNLDFAAGNLSTLTLDSPIDGIIQRIFVAPGQAIPASTVMFEVASFDPVWIRVPVYIGDLSKVDREKEAAITPMGTENGSRILHGKPIQGPPLSDVDNASSDLYYEIANKNGLFRIGEKVSVLLTQKSLGESLVIPWSAVLYDMYGGNWVYVKISPQVFSRRRVEVSHVTDNLAVLTRGVQPSDEVVIAGAAEIFGTEFGGGK